MMKMKNSASEITKSTKPESTPIHYSIKRMPSSLQSLSSHSEINMICSLMLIPPLKHLNSNRVVTRNNKDGFN